MYSLVVFFPLLSALIAGLQGRHLGEKGSSFLTINLIVGSWILALLIYWEVVFNTTTIEILPISWLNLGLFCLPWGFYFDELTATMLIVVLSISGLVHIYSSAYMQGDPHLPRFMAYLSLFTFFMLILVTSHNLLQLFIGWEGVGLCSYLLINFWFTRLPANKAAIKAMLVNRVGDIGLILAMFLLWIHLGSLEFSVIFSSATQLPTSSPILNWICFLLLLGAVGKSAQLGLHTWLPDAMEGPTPVSALIHAATMVTAGVFLIIRTSPLFELAPSALLMTTLIGSLTAFFAATIGLAQSDLKKVIAYSTCSQLGYMVLICGLSHYATGLFHLFNHAFFKALLFLSAGSIIHALQNEQDIRKAGSLRFFTPLSYLCLFIGSLSLIGLPFLTGFYSKDFILELAQDKMVYYFAFWLALTAAGLTAFYSFRLLFWTFYQTPTLSRHVFQHAHEGRWTLWLPLVILLLASVMIGYFSQYMILKDVRPPMLTTLQKWWPTFCSSLGVILALGLFYTFSSGWKNYLHPLSIASYAFLQSAWHFNYTINYFLVAPIWQGSLYIFYNLLDRQWLEYLGPEGVKNQLTQITKMTRFIQSGQLMSYLLLFLFFLTFYLYFF